MIVEQLAVEPIDSSRKPIRESAPPVEASRCPFKDAIRIQESVTSRVERKPLFWLAARMPSWINSDHLTLLGFAAMFLAGCSYALARWTPWGLLLATLFLALNWL